MVSRGEISKVNIDVAWLVLSREIDEILYTEAELLDERRYEEWLDLLTEDVQYRMPLTRNFKFGEQEKEFTRDGDVAWFDEGKETLRQRVRQILTGAHWAEEPSSRVSHLVTNIRIMSVVPTASNPMAVTVSSKYLVYRNRLQDETDFFVGKRRDVLRSIEGRWKIAKREIFLDQTVLLAKNLTLFF